VLVTTKAATLPEMKSQSPTLNTYGLMKGWFGDELDALLLDCAAMIEILGK
jgi:hypothetical protein